MRRQILLLIFSAIVYFGCTTRSFSYPRFAAYGGDKCIDCHVNPSGGAMRSEGGIGFAEKRLNMEMFKKLAGKTQFSPEITKGVTIGGDVRVAQVDHEVPSTTNYNSFLAMQGDLYINAQVNKIVNIFATSGIQIPGIDTKYEVYGMIGNLPANLYLKIGRFKPDYGIRIVEHRAFQRRYIWNAPYEANTGFELGVSPEWLNATVGLYNPMNLDFLGMDPHKMFVGTIDFNFSFKDRDFNVNVGGSFLNNPFNTGDSTATSTITANKKAFGAFTRIGILKRIAILGEIDFEELRSDFPLRRSLYGFAELNVRIIQGLELRGQFELYDRNRSIEGDDVKRISGGIAAFPFFGFETEAMVRFVFEDPSVDNHEFQWNFHFYF